MKQNKKLKALIGDFAKGVYNEDGDRLNLCLKSVEKLAKHIDNFSVYGHISMHEGANNTAYPSLEYNRDNKNIYSIIFEEEYVIFAINYNNIHDNYGKLSYGKENIEYLQKLSKYF